MLVEILFSIVSYLIKFFAWLLPAWQLPDIIIDGFRDVIGYLLIFDFIIPMQELLQVIYIITLFEITILSARAIAGLISIVRGGGEIKI